MKNDSRVAAALAEAKLFGPRALAILAKVSKNSTATQRCISAVNETKKKRGSPFGIFWICSTIFQLWSMRTALKSQLPRKREVPSPRVKSKQTIRRKTNG